MSTNVLSNCSTKFANVLSTEHLVILDWDDTIMPTSYLLSNIGFTVDPTTNRVTSIWRKSGSTKKTDEIRRTLKESGSAALRMLKVLYLHFADSASGRNLLIVTNGQQEWLWNSLTITGTLCPIYRQIEQLLRGRNTEIIFARNLSLDPNYWKMMSFDHILDRFLVQMRSHRLNVITIGDQWTDHCSIEMTPTFQRHRQRVSHHQIKLYPDSDAHYMSVELDYVSGLFLTDNSTDCILLQFAVNDDDGILIEFDGYLEDEECPPSPDSDDSTDTQ